MLGPRGADTPPTAGSHNLGGQDPHFASSSASNNGQTTSTSTTTFNLQPIATADTSNQFHREHTTTTAGMASAITQQQQQQKLPGRMADSDITGSRDREATWDFTVDRLSGPLHRQMGISHDGPKDTGGPSFGQSNERSLKGGTETPKEVDMDRSDGESSDGSVEFVDMPSLSIQTGSDSYSDWSMDSISSSEVADLREGEKQTAGEDTGGEMSTRATSGSGNCRPVGAPQGGRVDEDSSGDSLGPARSSQHRAPPKQPRERGGGLTGRRKSYKRKECNGGGPRKKRHTHSARLRRSQSRQDK